jgi:hypothetical protein
VKFRARYITSFGEEGRRMISSFQRMEFRSDIFIRTRRVSIEQEAQQVETIKLFPDSLCNVTPF